MVAVLSGELEAFSLSIKYDMATAEVRLATGDLIKVEIKDKQAIINMLCDAATKAINERYKNGIS